MRTARVAASLAVLVALLPSCGSDALRDLFTFSVDVEIPQQTIPGLFPVDSCDIDDAGSATPTVLDPLTIDMRSEEEFDGRGIIELFASVVLEEIVLRIVDVPEGDADDWDFLDSLRLFAEDPDTEEGPVAVAGIDPAPEGVEVLRIPGNGTDIADIASADEFVVTSEATGRAPCDDVVFEGVATFEIRIF